MHARNIFGSINGLYRNWISEIFKNWREYRQKWPFYYAISKEIRHGEFSEEMVKKVALPKSRDCGHCGGKGRRADLPPAVALRLLENLEREIHKGICGGCLYNLARYGAFLSPEQEEPPSLAEAGILILPDAVTPAPTPAMAPPVPQVPVLAHSQTKKGVGCVPFLGPAFLLVVATPLGWQALSGGMASPYIILQGIGFLVGGSLFLIGLWGGYDIYKKLN